MGNATKKYGWLKIVSFHSKTRYGVNMWKIECKCGKRLLMPKKWLTSGQAKTCGCDSYHDIRNGIINRTHGQSLNPIYKVWKSMVFRCVDSRSNVWKNYGGRGIRVCRRWRNFFNFYYDMGDRPKGLSIDRINNDGDYTPKNCRWATWSEQNSNKKRGVRKNANHTTKR